LCDENVGLLPEHVTLIVEALRRRWESWRAAASVCSSNVSN